MTRTSSPILWYGDLVDFGSFNDSVTHHDGAAQIQFEFGIDEIEIERRRFHPAIMSSNESFKIKNVNYSSSVVSSGQKNRTSSINVSLENSTYNISIVMNEKSEISAFLIDQTDVLPFLLNESLIVSPGALFPEIQVASKKPDSDFSVYWYQRASSHFIQPIKKHLRPHLDGRVKDNTLESVINRMLFLQFPDKQRLREFARTIKSQSLKRYIEDIVTKDTYELFPVLRDLIVASLSISVIESISSYLRSTFRSTLYIGPARAQSERYYRYQDLSVSEIDPDGKNFPMFLNSLTRIQIMNLSKWVESLFGYGIAVKQEAGHISINLVEGQNQTNIVDVGYGVSQILPVLGQIWWARERRVSPFIRYDKSGLTILAIEQPELHLHPAHQALLADALVGETKTEETSDNSIGSKTHYVIETHSETFINRLGELISKGVLRSKDVQVVLFEADEYEPSIASVRSVEFSEEGTLIDWPYGFFQAVVG